MIKKYYKKYYILTLFFVLILSIVIYKNVGHVNKSNDSDSELSLEIDSLTSKDEESQSEELPEVELSEESQLEEIPEVALSEESSKFFPVVAGEEGVVDTSYKYGHVHRYGAVGDGVTNDANAFKLAFDQNDTVYMEAKTYLWNDGVYMNRNQVINGNGARIITGENFEPTGDFVYGLLRYRYSDYIEGTQGKYEINDLTIHWNSLFTSDEDFVVFYPLGFAEVVLNRVNITSEKGNQTKLHLLYATEGENTYIGCNFINRSQGASGGVLWLNNMNESFIPKIYASHCIMTNYCSDELLALYGLGAYDLLFEDCELKVYNTYLQKDTLMMAFYGGSESKYEGTLLNCSAKFVRTLIECHDDENLSYHFVTMIGVGSDNWNRKALVEFEECIIVNDSLRNFTSARQSNEDLSDYNDPRHTNIKFYKSDITLKTAISGNFTAYKLKEAGSANPNVSMELVDCNIICRHGLVDSSNQVSFSYDFIMDNCDVDIKEARGLIMFYHRDSCLIRMTNNRIKTDQEVEIISYIRTDLNERMPKDGYESVYIRNNIVNAVDLNYIETFVSYE